MTDGSPLGGCCAVLPSLGMVDLGLQLLKLLAVVGGAAVGGVGSGWLLRLSARVWAHRAVPPRATQVVKLLGAVALGWAVWLWVYGPGGSGWGQGGGLGGVGSRLPQGSGTQPAAPSPVQPEGPTETSPNKTATTEREPVGRGEVVRVEMLGGARVREQRFYRLEGETEPRTLAELRQVIEERRQQPPRPALKSIEIVIYENSVSKDHPAVRDLEKWARENDVTPILSFPKRDLPS